MQTGPWVIGVARAGVFRPCRLKDGPSTAMQEFSTVFRKQKAASEGVIMSGTAVFLLLRIYWT
jgi:hypothetical protein